MSTILRTITPIMDSALNQGFDNETKLVMVNQRFGDEERDLRHL